MTAATEVRCIRQPGAVWTLCRCEPCRVSNRKMAKRNRAGLAVVEGREAAWARLASWHRRGWSPKLVADVTGVGNEPVRDYYAAMDRGAVIPMTQLTVRRVLAAGDEPTGTGLLPAIGTMRRLQALTVMGWSMDELSARYNTPPKTLSCIRSGRLRSIRGESAQLVSRIYEELWDQRGPGRRAATQALHRGWVGPLAWDDETIDSPETTPAGCAPTRAVHRGRPVADTVEDVRFLLDADAALPNHAAAHRLGLKPKSLTTALERAADDAYDAAAAEVRGDTLGPLTEAQHDTAMRAHADVIALRDQLTRNTEETAA